MPRKHDRRHAPDGYTPWPRWRVVRNRDTTTHTHDAWAAWGPTHRRFGGHPDDAAFATHAEAIAYADRMARTEKQQGDDR